jgi:hypothetical protein
VEAQIIILSLLCGNAATEQQAGAAAAVPRRGKCEEDAGEGGDAKTGVDDVVTSHGKERLLRTRARMLLEEAHRPCPASMGPIADHSSISASARERW